MGSDDPDLDLSKFDFPTDKLTIKDLRRLYPGRLDNRDVSMLEDCREGSVYEKMAELISEERIIAIDIYDQARGKKRPFGLRGKDLKDALEELAEDYIKFDLASGPTHAKELARSVKSQALRQAERHGGKGR
jgi:hypothetical protein